MRRALMRVHPRLQSRASPYSVGRIRTRNMLIAALDASLPRTHDQGPIMIKTVRTPTLEIAYLETGPGDGAPVVLLHGWPSDVHDWDDVARALAGEVMRVLVPYLRGFGPTRFLESSTPRSGQQAALGADLRDFLDAL